MFWHTFVLKSFSMNLSFSSLLASTCLLIGVIEANAASNELSSVARSAISDTLVTSQIISTDFHITADHQGVLDSLEALGVLEGRTIAAGVTNIFSLWDSLQAFSAAPTMTITAAELNDGDLSNATTLSLTLVSTKKTSTFHSEDITVTNGSISELNGTGDGGAEYTAIFTIGGDGECTIDVAEGVYESLTGSLNEAAEQFSWTFDGTSPTLTMTATEVIDGDASNDGTLSLTFTSSESTSDFAVDDVTTSNGTLSAFAGSGATYTATLTPDDEGAVTIDVAGSAFTDAATNDNTAATQFNWTYDVTAPTMTITADEVTDGETSSDAYLSLNFTSSESTADFGDTDIIVTNGALATFAGSGTTYTATFTPTGDGECSIDVAGSNFTDAAGNNNTAADQFNWTKETPASTTATWSIPTTGSVAEHDQTGGTMIQLPFTAATDGNETTFYIRSNFEAESMQRTFSDPTLSSILFPLTAGTQDVTITPTSGADTWIPATITIQNVTCSCSNPSATTHGACLSVPFGPDIWECTWDND